MNSNYIIDWIELSGVRIAVNPSDPSYNPNNGALCFEVGGLFDTGSPITSSEERTLREGTILPPKTLRAGKNFTLNIYVFGTRAQVFSRINNLQSTLYAGHFRVDTNRGYLNPCVIENFTVGKEQWKNSTDDFLYIPVTLEIQSASPYFVFT